MNVVRALLAVAVLGTLFLTPLWVQTPSGTEIVLSGLIIDLVALAVLVWVGWSWWRGRQRTQP